jgi:hypothetical protein
MSHQEHNQNQESQMFSREPESKPEPKPEPKPHKLTRPEIIGALNAIIDLYSDVPIMPPKVGDAPKVVVAPRVVPPQVSRVPTKITLPENKRRDDAMLDVLDTLRTFVKYSLFDRDALRREVKFLKQLVEDLGGKI